MAVLNLFKLSMLLTLLSNVKSSTTTQKQIVPPQCSRIECPPYDVLHSGDDYEIRAYDSNVWASSSPVLDNSFVNGTRTGFQQLFSYFQGENKYKQKIEMTAPVVTEIAPYCELSGYLVGLYVPKKNQADPPPPTNGVTVKTWAPNYVAVRQFNGFALDSNVCDEAAALSASLSGTIWLDAINKSFPGLIVVAQYNSPFDFDNRVNEIWLFMDPSAIQQPGYENKHVYE